MLDRRQLAILTEMGIPVWELRSQQISQPATSKVTDVISTALNAEFYEPLPAVDCLIVVTEQDNNEKAKRLLHAMLFSIGLTPNNSAIVSAQQLSQLQTSPYPHKALIVFGEQLVPQTLNSQAVDRGRIHSSADPALKIIISLSLMDLLNSPDKKVLAWQDLQLLKAACQSDDVP